MNIENLTEKLKSVAESHSKKYGIKINGDLAILKLQEEIGELVQAYLMHTKRARSKGINEEELKINFEKEVVDALGILLLLIDEHKIDLQKTLERKWFTHL